MTTDTTPLPPHIEEMRRHLMATLTDLRDRQNPMEVDRAKAVADVARVMVDSAKVEVEYIKATGAQKSNFIEPPVTTPQLTNGGEPFSPGNGITSIVRHRLPG
jgi:hypothetical protein